jgi:septal ring factor EnvC (AmiA/AmiB activator)
MTMQVRLLPVAVCLLLLFCTHSLAQTPARRQTNSTSQAQEQSPTLPPNADSTDTVANELGLLRKSLQTLNARLREISEKVLAPGANPGGSANDKQDRISRNLDLLTRTEQRAEVLRKQLFELIEKETSLKTRLVQLEEEMRPESIERTMNLVGSTRVAEMRDTRRRVLDNERKGIESLLIQTGQNRLRLEEDVKQADALVYRLRQRLFPLIDKEIEKIEPN